MANVMADGALEQDNSPSAKPTGSQQPQSTSGGMDMVEGVDDDMDEVSVGLDMTDEADEDKNEPQDELRVKANLEDTPNEDADWSRARQCLSVFHIEVFQCKLCFSFNSTRKAAIAEHLEEKHAGEWETVADNDSTPSPATDDSKKSALTQGDLEEMIERELIVGNQRKPDGTPTVTPKQSAVITIPAQQSTLQNQSTRGPQRIITGPVSVGNNAVFLPFVSVQTAPAGMLQPTSVRQLPQATTGTNAVVCAKNKRGRGRPKSLPSITAVPSVTPAPKGVGNNSRQLAVSQSEESIGSGKSHSAGPCRISLRPGLRRSADRKPREFKDYVLVSPSERGSGVEGNPGAEDDDDKDVVYEKENEEDKSEGVDEPDEQQDDLKGSEQAPRVSQRKLQCPKCLMTFGTRDALKRHSHLQRCIGVPITSKEFPCPSCDYTGISAASLRIHLHSHRQRREKRYGCASCRKGFTTIKGVKKHRRNNRCPALKQKKPKGPKMFTCDQCGKECKEKRGLREHMATHSEIRLYKCDFCSKGFKTPGSLRRHRKKHQDRFFYCDQCKFKSRWRSSLKTHFEAHHAEDSREWLQCPQCPHQTKNKYYLKRHIESHTDTRMFICEVCGKDFKTEIILNVHRGTHEEGTYPCEKCNYVGKTKMQLYSHQLVHIPRDKMTYKCDQCSWVGKRKSELSVHYRKHSTLKLYQCSGCGKSYKHKHALTRHMSEKHLRKTLVLDSLEMEGMVSHAGENTVLNTVQDIIHRAQMGLKVTHQGQTLTGIPAIVHAAQQYHLIQSSEIVEEVDADQSDQIITHEDGNVAMTSVPVAKFFEITTSGVGHQNESAQATQ
ncbi:telomere zinc finger-associated protein-like [Acanthaster planci]|uniref:Telomere zinc finger-associated protein-like n=1 Tax=Acanthaster planci TaxID=133434 RepID=A0A8B7XMD9_ACAPL|nr:telomere zinc finger-associated protein-like [Acanthaster planci]